MGYCSKELVRERTGLTTTEIGETELASMIDMASQEINNQLNIKVMQEKVEYFQVPWKPNTIDSSNTEFYTKNYPLGDTDEDFTVGTADITVWTWNGLVKTDCTVSSVDDETGQFTLSSAPETSVAVYCKYEYLFIPLSDKMIEKACTELAAFYAVKRIHGRGIKSYSLGPFKINKGDTVGKDFWDEYERSLNQIRRRKFVIVEGDDLMDIPFNGE